MSGIFITVSQSGKKHGQKAIFGIRGGYTLGIAARATLNVRLGQTPDVVRVTAKVTAFQVS